MPELRPTQEDPDSESKLSRREFAQRAALAATAAVVVPAALLAQESAPQPTPKPPTAPSPTSGAAPQSSPPLSPALEAEGELKYQWVIQNYGSRLSDAEKKDAHRLIMEGQKPLAALRAFPLDNADQPATVLKFTEVEMSS